MDITLEKIELVKDRTGASYSEAKEALESANGSVVDAVIAIEENINEEFLKEPNNPLFQKVKEMGDKMDINSVIEKAKDVAEKGIEVGKEYYDKIDKDKVVEYANMAADKAVELGKKGFEIGKEYYDKIDKEKVAEYADIAVDKAKEYAEIAVEKGKEFIDKLNDK